MSLLATLITFSVISSQSEVQVFNSNYVEFDELFIFLHKINEGSRIVHDMCESLEDKSSMLYGTNKPSCQYNVSYIKDTEIVVSNIKDPVREFFMDKKKAYCKVEKLECGELTITIKLLDLVNSGVKLTNNHNFSDLWVNLKIIDFYDLFNLYSTSLNNIELLTNITLARQKANIILNREKNRLKSEESKNTMYGYLGRFSTLIGTPLKDTLVFAGDTIGTTLGTTIGTTFGEISPIIANEFKIFIGVVLLIIIIKR
tara:strand:- start:282 stop:1052 length:771 start_codon:yes stop_codon:yes gene_type:complete